MESQQATISKDKNKENWQDTIKYCHNKLDSTTENHEKILILNELSSCYFYLGNYQDAIKYASNVLEFNDKPKNVSQQIRAMYLISAGNRALLNQDDSLKYINKALELLESKTEEPIDKIIEAKLYFNAGALQQDLYNQPEKGLQYYNLAMKCFEKDSEDYIRTVIRSAGCLLKIDKFDESENLSRDLKVNKDTRSYVHLLQLQSKIYIKKEKYSDALKTAEEALCLAKNKAMKGDEKRLEELIVTIKSNIPNKSDVNIANFQQASAFRII